MPSFISQLKPTYTGRGKATEVGNAGYDNPRENIDPHIKTKVVSTKEIASGARVLGFLEVLGTLSGGNIVAGGGGGTAWLSGAGYIYPATKTDIISGAALLIASGAKFQSGARITMETQAQNEDGEMIRLKFNSTDSPNAKAVIAFQDQVSGSKAWLACHDYLTFPGTQHKHFSIEISDSIGQLQSRLIFPYDQDQSLITFNQSDVKIDAGYLDVNGGIDAEDNISGATLISKGNINMSGSFNNGTNLDIYPNNQSSRGVRIYDDGSMHMQVLGASELVMEDAINLKTNMLSMNSEISGARWVAFREPATKPSQESNVGKLFTSGGALYFWGGTSTLTKIANA